MKPMNLMTGGVTIRNFAELFQTRPSQEERAGPFPRVVLLPQVPATDAQPNR